MDRIVFFRRVGAGELDNYFCAAWMLGKEIGDVVDVAVENDPAALCCVVLCNCPVASATLIACLEGWCLGNSGYENNLQRRAILQRLAIDPSSNSPSS